MSNQQNQRDSFYESLWLQELMYFENQSRTLKNWRPIEYLDMGTFSRIFKVRHVETGRIGALKFVPNPLEVANCSVLGSQEAEFHRSRFEASKREAEIMNRFHGEAGVAQYLEEPEYLMRTFLNKRSDTVVQYAVLILMPLYRNHREWIPQVAGYRRKSLQLGMEIAQALMLFEEKGVYHRDIKPGNIMQDEEGHFCLADVGEAKLESEFTTTGFHGTRPYMAPEVYNQENERAKMHSDHRSDIYSLGMILYRLFNHQQFPFLMEGGVLTEDATKTYHLYEKRHKLEKSGSYLTDSERARLLRYDGEELPPPEEADEQLAQVILRACAFDKEDRYQTAKDLYEALRCCLEGKRLRPGLQYKKKKKRRKKGGDRRNGCINMILAANVLLFALILAGVGFVVWGNKGDDAPAVQMVMPTANPMPIPTATPTIEPTATPTIEPTATPTLEPTATLTLEPTVKPTPEPTATPTPEPTATPTPEPTATPTLEPTATPTPEPTATPTLEPTATPTVEPTGMPVAAETDLLDSSGFDLVDTPAYVSVRAERGGMMVCHEAEYVTSAFARLCSESNDAAIEHWLVFNVDEGIEELALRTLVTLPDQSTYEYQTEIVIDDCGLSSREGEDRIFEDLALENCFANLMDSNQKIQSGTYRIEQFLENEKIHETTFGVVESEFIPCLSEEGVKVIDPNDWDQTAFSIEKGEYFHVLSFAPKYKDQEAIYLSEFRESQGYVNVWDVDFILDNTLQAVCEKLAAKEAEAAPQVDQPIQAGYRDGTYTASADGMFSDVMVTVRIENGAIKHVSADVSGETMGLGAEIGDEMARRILNAQGTEGVDAISGASVTGKAVLKAAQSCLEAASAPVMTQAVDPGVKSLAEIRFRLDRELMENQIAVHGYWKQGTYRVDKATHIPSVLIRACAESDNVDIKLVIPFFVDPSVEEMQFKTVFKGPDGSTFEAESVMNITNDEELADHQNLYLYWNGQGFYYDLTAETYFKQLLESGGSVMNGTYKAEQYVQGEWVCETSFEVVQSDVIPCLTEETRNVFASKTNGNLIDTMPEGTHYQITGFDPIYISGQAYYPIEYDGKTGSVFFFALQDMILDASLLELTENNAKALSANAAQSASPAASSSAYVEIPEDYKTTNMGKGTCSITDYRGNDAYIRIPSMIDGKTVVDLRYNSFDGVDTLVGVQVPDTVTAINESAFYDCDGLVSIEIPDSVTKIGMAAFCKCSSLENVRIPSGIKKIQDTTFSYCTSLKDVEIPEGVTSIGAHAFNACCSLTSIEIPQSVKNIDSKAFEQCTALEEVRGVPGTAAEKLAKQLGVRFVSVSSE